MKPNFIKRAAKIIADVRARTCINDDDAEALEELLQDALHDCYALGYDDGTSILNGDVDSAYDAGYALGHSDGYYEGHDEGYCDGCYEGHSEGYSEGHSDGYDEGYASGYSACVNGDF